VVHVISVIAATALLAGLLEILAGKHLRRHVQDECFLIAGGTTSVLFSGFLLSGGSRETSSLLNWIAVYAAANGLAMIGLAYRLHRVRRTIHDVALPEHLEQSVKKAGAA